MTWTKLSDDFGDDCARADLSDAAFRTHVEGLLWTMRREADGHLDERDVRRFAETDDPAAAVQELVNAGFWTVNGDGAWTVVHHLDHQPESDVMAARRAANAERQRRKRRKAAGVEEDPSRRDGTRDDHRDDTRDPGRVGSGRDGSGPQQASTTEGEQAQPGERDDTSVPADLLAAPDGDEPPFEDPPEGWEQFDPPTGDVDWPAPAPLGRGPRRRGWAA